MTRTATGTTTVHEQLLSLIATCPKRTTLMGGGFNSDVLASGAAVDVHAVYESRRLSPSQWIISGARLDTDSGGNPLDLTTYARCRAQKKAKKPRAKSGRSAASAAKRGRRFKVTETSAGVPLLPGVLTSATTTASCPGPRKVISGGFSLAPPPFAVDPDPGAVLVTENRRTSAGGWTVAAAQFSPLQRTLAAFAYCAPGKAPKERSATAFLAGTSRSTVAVDSPPCPPRLQPGSGGFLTAVASPDVGAPFFLTSAPSGAGWHALAIQSGMGTGANVTAYGYCL